MKQPPADWQCAIAYNAALQAATALAAAGYRATRDNHHDRVIQSLEFTTAPGRKFFDTLDGFPKKPNVSNYDVAGCPMAPGIIENRRREYYLRSHREEQVPVRPRRTGTRLGGVSRPLSVQVSYQVRCPW